MEETLDHIFHPEGLLDSRLNKYEYRKEQAQMAEQIDLSFADEKIALIEAGTGTGKSLAYLIPALLWAAKREETVVISTHTIALQEQLLYKDIPFALDLLDLDLSVVLVKGMQNYVCKRDLDIQSDKVLSLLPEERKPLALLEAWADRRHSGSRSDIDFFLPPSLWERVKARREKCTAHKCPQFSRCFFYKARKKASQAQVLLVNHHLLFTDYVQRKEEKGALLSYERLIVDEAHHLESVARHTLALHLKKNHTLTLLQSIQSSSEKIPSLLEDLNDLFSELWDISKSNLTSKKDRNKTRFRLTQKCFDLKPYLELQEAFTLWSKDCALIISNLKGYEESLERDQAMETLKSLQENVLGFLEKWRSGEFACWIESDQRDYEWIAIPYSLAHELSENFFPSLKTAVLCSATLTTQNQFSYIKERLGLNSFDVTEGQYPSSFDWANQSMMLLPSDFPYPHEPSFYSASVSLIKKSLDITKGGALLLFTSYEALKQMGEALALYCEERSLNLLIQGEKERSQLLDEFRAGENNVLLATDSFWEGVDLPGHVPRLVVLMKLPFKVPTDPYVEAMSEAIEKEKKNAFMHYLLPEAIIKFKQGMGRLIRTKEDKGCILCLDRRLMEKSYGRSFLSSIPSSSMVYEAERDLLSKMRQFFESWSVAESNR